MQNLILAPTNLGTGRPAVAKNIKNGKIKNYLQKDSFLMVNKFIPRDP